MNQIKALELLERKLKIYNLLYLTMQNLHIFLKNKNPQKVNECIMKCEKLMELINSIDKKQDKYREFEILQIKKETANLLAKMKAILQQIIHEKEKCIEFMNDYLRTLNLEAVEITKKKELLKKLKNEEKLTPLYLDVKL
ncbi:MAG: hypothetical protein N2317_06060 [Syntrophales bacterium]|nr:hypothetical protein [Syntrophales bacterium]